MSEEKKELTLAEALTAAEMHELNAATINVDRWRTAVELQKTRVENARLMGAAAQRMLDQAAAKLQEAERTLAVLKASPAKDSPAK